MFKFVDSCTQLIRVIKVIYDLNKHVSSYSMVIKMYNNNYYI